MHCGPALDAADTDRLMRMTVRVTVCPRVFLSMHPGLRLGQSIEMLLRDGGVVCRPPASRHGPGSEQPAVTPQLQRCHASVAETHNPVRSDWRRLVVRTHPHPTYRMFGPVFWIDTRGPHLDSESQCKRADHHVSLETPAQSWATLTNRSRAPPRPPAVLSASPRT